MAGSTADSTDGASEVTGDEYDSLRYTAGAVVGGVVGTALMTAAFAGTNEVYGPDLSVYATLADLAGVATGNAVGFAMFVGAGAVAWPLLFASLGPYLPGESSVVRGLVFAVSLWMGFLAGFAADYAGTDLVVFVVFSGVTHLVYGALLGLFGSKATGGGAPPRPEV